MPKAMEDVLAHVMLQFAPSIDNVTPANDYYATNWWPGVGVAPKNEGSTNWQNRGGYIRERTLPMQVGEHPKGAGLSVALPLSDSDWQVVMWRIECRRAQAMGIGGFMPDIQTITPGDANFNRVLYLCTAAAAEGHKIMLCPDMAVMTGITASQLVTAIQSCYNAAGTAGAALKRDANGKVLISPYLGGGTAAEARDATFWNAVTSGLASVGINISLLAVPNGMPSYVTTLFDGLANKAGFGIWGERNPGTSSSIDGLGATMKARTGNSNLIWCYPVSARDARHRDMQFDENWGFNQWLFTLRRMSAQAPGAVDLILIMTWNDLSETSGINLTDRDPVGCWGKIAKPYFDNWRNGIATTAVNVPTSTLDEVFVISRQQVLGATVELNAQMTAGTAYTSLSVKNLTQIPTGENTITAAQRAQLTVGAKLHTREGEIMTIAAQPAVNASTVSIQSFTPTVTYGAGTVFTRAIWTYVPGVGNYKPSVNRGDSGGSDSCTPNKDTYQLLTRLTAAGDITVTDAGGAHTFTAPAGESLQEYPVVAGAKPTGTLSRGGAQQLAFAGRYDIASAPLVQDVGWYPSYASNPPTTLPTQQTNPAATKMRQARSTRAKLTAKNATPAGGQLVEEYDTGDLVIGDNATPYNSLVPLSRKFAQRVRKQSDLPDLNVVDVPIDTGFTISTAVTATPTTGYRKWAPPLVTLNTGDKRWNALVLGGADIIQGTSGDSIYVKPTSKGGSGGHTFSNGQDVCAYEWEMTGQTFQWAFKYTATSNAYRLVIDGKPYKLIPQSVAGTTVGSTHMMTVNMASAKPRRIRLEVYNTPMMGVFLAATDSMNAPPAPTLRAAFQGDSLTDGSAVNTAGPLGTYAYQFGRMAGFRDIWEQAIGGTGYLNPGAWSTLGARAALDIIPYSPTDLFVFAGYNDLNYSPTPTAAQIAAAADAHRAAVQAGCPKTRFYQLGMHRPYDQYDTDILAADTALQAMAAAARVPFISPATGNVVDERGNLVQAQGPWILGTGKASALNASGNSDVMIGSDGVHLTDLGHWHYARRLLSAYTALLA